MVLWDEFQRTALQSKCLVEVRYSTPRLELGIKEACEALQPNGSSEPFWPKAQCNAANFRDSF